MVLSERALARFERMNCAYLRCRNVKSSGVQKTAAYHIVSLSYSPEVLRQKHIAPFVLRVHNNLVDPASSHMLVLKIKPCMSKYKLLYGETANGSLKQL